MSLGGPYAASVSLAVQVLVDSGMVVTVAAGNENSNACKVSPAGAVSGESHDALPHLLSPL